MTSKGMLFTALVLLVVCKTGGRYTQHTCNHRISAKALTCLAMLPFTRAMVNVSGVEGLKLPDRTILKVKAGIDAGKAILDVFKSDDDPSSFFSKIGDIAKKISPFLGGIGSIFGFLDFFVPKGPSIELQYMVKQFAQLDKRFDEVFAKLDDVEALIVKKAVRGQYGHYEAMVYSLSERLSKVIDAKINNLSKTIYEDRKQKFVKEFDKVSLHEALDALYLGLTEKSTILIDITQSVRKYSYEDRKKVQIMMENVLNLIIKGAKAIVAYDLLKGNNTTPSKLQHLTLNATIHDDTTKAEDTITEWVAKIKEITYHIKATDESVMRKWEKQLKLDVVKMLKLKKGVSNKKFADYLYSFLKSKYGWRNWYVVVYNAVSGDEMHYVQTGRDEASYVIGGLEAHFNTWFDVEGRNIIITSDIIQGVSKPLDYGFVNRRIQEMHFVYTKTSPWFWGTWTRDIPYNAHELYDHMPASLKHLPCDDSSFFETGRGVIKRSADPQYRAPKGYYATVDRGSYRFHVFGHCVHWWTDSSGTSKRDGDGYD